MFNHSCPNYLQKANALEDLENEILKLGESACVLLNSQYVGDIKLLFRNCPVDCLAMDAEVSDEMKKAYTKIIIDNELEVLVAIGNEHVIKLSKILATQLRLPLILVPTVLDIDLDTADLVLVDETLLLNVPIKSFRYAIADTLATYMEGLNTSHSLTYHSVAKTCFNTLLSESENAYEALRTQTSNLSLSSTIEALLYMKCFLVTSNEDSLITQLYMSLKNFPPLAQLSKSETKSFSLLIALKIINHEKLFNECFNLYQKLAIPQTFSEIAIELDENQLRDCTSSIILSFEEKNIFAELSEFVLYQAIQSVI